MEGEGGVQPGQSVLITNKWSVLLALQTRLDAGLVGTYEAVLALFAIRLLFPRDVDVENLLPTVDSLWPMKVHEHLLSIVEAREWSGDSEDEEWMAVWQAMHVAEKFISKKGVKILLASARAMKGDERDVHPIQDTGEAAGDH